MIQGRCPICAKPFQTATLKGWPAFPFCSERCRLVDLGRWIDGNYALPIPESPTTHLPDQERADDRDNP
jgi:endogenous inhibitor of DNA gyrase (YacG/DUF329 family)